MGGGACFSALVVQASPLTLVLKYRLHLFPARSVFKHHQTSLMSRLGGTGSAFRWKTDLLSLKGITFIPSATKAAEQKAAGTAVLHTRLAT